MSYNTWPTFVGRGWGIKKRPITRTIIQTADSGAEYRIGRYQTPLYEFDIEIPYLSQADYATLQHFFAQQGGPFTPFLFYPDNEAATATPFFTGDGVTTQATLTMPDGSPALFANSGATPNVTAIHQTDWQGRLALSSQSRTNYWINSSFSGAAVGTLPSSWGMSSGATGGLTAACVGIGTTSFDVPYIDIQFTGTQTAQAAYFSIFASQFPNTVNGTTYLGTVLEQLVASSESGTDISHGLQVFELSGGQIALDTVGATAPNGFTAYAASIVGQAKGGVYPRVLVSAATNAGKSINRTLRICAPSLTAGAAMGAYIPCPASTTATVTDYTQAGNQITFGQVPAVGAVEDWDGTYEYLVRFKDDQIEMTQTMNQVYEATTITLRSVR